MRGAVLAVSAALPQVGADGLTFAVRVSRQVDGFHVLGRLLQLLMSFFLPSMIS